MKTQVKDPINQRIDSLINDQKMKQTMDSTFTSPRNTDFDLFGNDIIQAIIKQLIVTDIVSINNNKKASDDWQIVQNIYSDLHLYRLEQINGIVDSIMSKYSSSQALNKDYALGSHSSTAVFKIIDFLEEKVDSDLTNKDMKLIIKNCMIFQAFALNF